jgi:hypothetical protein
MNNTERHRRLVQPITRATARARIGSMSGATSMAPMTTAVELAWSPKAAISTEKLSSQRKRFR